MKFMLLKFLRQSPRFYYAFTKIPQDATLDEIFSEISHFCYSYLYQRKLIVYPTIVLGYSYSVLFS